MATKPTRDEREDAEPTSIDPGWLQKGTLIGYYEIVDRVGAGGFGALYKAVRDGKPYALKIANRNVLELPEDDRRRFEERIEREVVSLMSLRHPNIVKVHAYDRWPDGEGFQYIVMEFIAGYRIGDWCARQSPSLRSILNAFRKLALALAEMHRLEIYHRDLKQENVMVRAADEEPFLVDFGISRPRSAVTVTREMSIFGTYTHFSPEYCSFFGSESYLRGELFPGFTPATELWSYGVLLYEVLTGVLPFAEHSKKGEVGYLEAIQSETPKHPGLINTKIPDEVDAFILRFLEKRPPDRFQSGREVAQALEQMLQTEDPAWDAPFDVPNRRAPPRVSGMPGSGKSSTQTRPGRPQLVAAPVLSGDGEANAPLPPPVPSDASVEVVLSADVAGSSAPQAKPPALSPVRSGTGTAERMASRAAAAAHAQVMVGAPAVRISQPRPVMSPGAFSPPTAERAEFVAPEAAAAESPTTPVARPQPGADIIELRSRLAGTTKPSANRALFAAVGGAALMGFGVLFLASQGGEKVAPPQSLLQKSQANGDPTVVDMPSPKETTLPPKEQVPPKAATGDALLEPLVTDKKGGGRAKVAKAGKGDDAQKIDAMLKDTYGRPVIDGPPEKKSDGKTGPAWLLQAESVEDVKAEAAGDKRYGVPMGDHIKVKLRTNLDSRTVADGPVEAMLLKPHIVRGNAVLPSRTMVYGMGSTSGGRFVIRFAKLRLPDHTEVDLKGLAFDIAQKRPGLSPSRRITASREERPGLMADVAKGAANTLLGKTGEGTASELAQGAGQTVLRAEGQGSSSGGDALLLDAGAEFAVFVEEAF